MHEPAARRRWDYFSLPVLHRDRLVRKVDPSRTAMPGFLRVDAIREDEPLARPQPRLSAIS